MLSSRGFPAVARRDARILLLGTLPSQESLRRGQYYAQPRNAFWQIMGELFGALPALPYPLRLERLRSSGIALWDVCAAAERSGSLDSAIRPASVEPNDFAAFFAVHDGIGKICFNGAKAAEIYRRRVLSKLSARWARVPLVILPSTSPAHASMSLEEKLWRWSRALEHA